MYSCVNLHLKDKQATPSHHWLIELENRNSYLEMARS